MYKQVYLQEISEGVKILQESLPNFYDKTILVTGATGVIGREFVDIILENNRTYHRNNKVLIVGRDKKKSANIFNRYSADDGLDIYNYDELDQIMGNVDYVVHLASVTSSKMFIEQPVQVLEESYLLTKKMLDFALLHNSRFMYVSSVEVYGKPNAGQNSFSEDMHGKLLTSEVRNSYPEAKRFCEMLTTSYSSQYGLDAVVVRPVKVFSILINDNDKRVFADFARKVKCKQDIVLKTDGKQEFSYCYGLDVALGIMFALLKGKCGQVYNVGNEMCQASIYGIATEYARQGDVNVVFDIEDETKTGYVKVGHCIVDSKKLYSLGFNPQISISSGISRIISYVREE